MEQKQVLATLKMGYSVYLTGAAGSGKTYVLNQYIKYLKEHKIGVGITASTGIAATHLNGMTIHSWSGIGIKDSLSEGDISNIMDKYDLRMRFLKTKVLIIDEISMLHAYRLDMVDKVCRAFKMVDKPFGGLQVILCGDFFQLPPVTRGSEDGRFAYKSDVWQEMDLKVCYIDEQHRQEGDNLLSVLNDIRNNNVTQDTFDFLSERYNKYTDGFLTPTRLYTHNMDVDAINSVELKKINSDEKIFKMQSEGKKEIVQFLKKNCLAPETLGLKVGAAVMFVKNNYEKGYVNGTLGKVVGFEKQSGNPVVETKDGIKISVETEEWMIDREGAVVAKVIQIPLRLAWAITVHKSQGMSLDAIEVDLSKSFVPGMGYVALSRARTLSGIRLVGINNMALQVSPEIIEIDLTLKNSSTKHKEYIESLDEKEIEEKTNEFLGSAKK